MRNDNKSFYYIDKPNQYHIKCDKQHYGLVRNELAKQYDREGRRLRVADKDGYWLRIDDSFMRAKTGEKVNFEELETEQSKRASFDMDDTVVPFFNALRGNKPAVDFMESLRDKPGADMDFIIKIYERIAFSLTMIIKILKEK